MLFSHIFMNICTFFSYLTLLLAFGTGINVMMASIDNKKWVDKDCQHEVRTFSKIYSI